MERGTSKDYRHGHDITITRAHIAAEQAQRLADSLSPATPAEIVKAFVHFPEQRHYYRARRLM